MFFQREKTARLRTKKYITVFYCWAVKQTLTLTIWNVRVIHSDINHTTLESCTDPLNIPKTHTQINIPWVNVLQTCTYSSPFPNTLPQSPLNRLPSWEALDLHSIHNEQPRKISKWSLLSDGTGETEGARRSIPPSGSLCLSQYPLFGGGDLPVPSQLPVRLWWGKVVGDSHWEPG